MCIAIKNSDGYTCFLILNVISLKTSSFEVIPFQIPPVVEKGLFLCHIETTISVPSPRFHSNSVHLSTPLLSIDFQNHFCSQPLAFVLQNVYILIDYSLYFSQL